MTRMILELLFSGLLGGVIGALVGSYCTHRLTVRRENDQRQKRIENTRKVLLTGLKNLNELDEHPDDVNPSTIALDKGLNGAAFGYAGENLVELTKEEIDVLTAFQDELITFNTRVQRGMRDFEPRFRDLAERREEAIEILKKHS